MKDYYECGLCGTRYRGLNNYMECVAKCGEKALDAQKKTEEEKKRLEKVNSALNCIKAAKEYYEEQLVKFKEEYPAEYKLNFGKKDSCSNGTCKCSDNKPKPKSETIKLSYEDDGKNKPKMSAQVNGKDVSDESLKDLLKKDLLNDPETRFIAQLLGII